jgi:6-phosphogluconolactonase (cycloisomerase 2 family)
MMRWVMSRRRLAALLAVTLVSTVMLWAETAPVEALGAAGAVYTLTNQAGGNEVAIFKRGWDGALTPAGAVATGGLGTSGGLGSQGALALSASGRWLFAVNAGSNEISAFAVASTGDLTLVDKVGSGGVRPVSLTQHHNLLYVLNAGTATEAGAIAGFRVGPRGTLTPLAGSSRPLSQLNSGGAQVQFSPSGRLLVVTERLTNRILTYTLGADGLPSGPAIHPSSGAVPFGFGFARQGRLVVSEAGARAVSSYAVSPSGDVSVISGSVPTDQIAACWIAVTPNGRFAYTTNAGSASITGYLIRADGSLARLDPAGPTATTGQTPIDMAISRYGKYLYVLEGGAHTVSGFEISNDGRLSPVNSAGALPAGAVGLAAW